MLKISDYARHPALSHLCATLAATPGINDDDRLRLVEAAAMDAKINALDLEMVGAPSVPFATGPQDPARAYDDGVAHHVRLIQARRRA